MLASFLLIAIQLGDTMRAAYQALVSLMVITGFLPYLYIFGSAWKAGKRLECDLGLGDHAARDSVLRGADSGSEERLALRDQARRRDYRRDRDGRDLIPPRATSRTRRRKVTACFPGLSSPSGLSP